MHKDAREYLERAAECARLAEGVDHPELKLYLTTLAASWTKVAAETVEAQLQRPRPLQKINGIKAQVSS
jgi:hypothetical protein